MSKKKPSKKKAPPKPVNVPPPPPTARRVTLTPPHEPPPGVFVKKLFQLGQAVKVPKKVSDDQKATVVGFEWGAGNKATQHCPTWAYYLKFTNRSTWWVASQEELVEWNQ